MGKPRGQNEIILTRSEDIECRNFCFTTASLTDGESPVRRFKLVRQGPECDGLNCNHGRYKAINKICHKILDESGMFTSHVEFSTTLNFVCDICIGEGGISAEIFLLEVISANNSGRSAGKRCNGMRQISTWGF